MRKAQPPDLSQRLSEVLARTTPLLPPDELRAYVQYHFDRRDLYLEVLERHPLPLYLQESSILRDRAGRLKRAFQKVLPAVGFYYAVKSNNHPDIARVLFEAEFGLDVSSGLELEMALNLGAAD
ncbi:MAG: decarboxylase, partial [Deltaproteobacteria bacterium]|nr:decarboxylase [Deltaproteobacteria bacterium]